MHVTAVISTTDMITFTTHLHTVPHGPRCSKNAPSFPSLLPTHIGARVSGGAADVVGLDSKEFQQFQGVKDQSLRWFLNGRTVVPLHLHCSVFGRRAVQGDFEQRSFEMPLLFEEDTNSVEFCFGDFACPQIRVNPESRQQGVCNDSISLS